jgi:hypothetical protein
VSVEGFHPTGPISTETLAELDVDAWPLYRKIALTHAIRVAGPFTVETSRGRSTARTATSPSTRAATRTRSRPTSSS